MDDHDEEAPAPLDVSSTMEEDPERKRFRRAGLIIAALALLLLLIILFAIILVVLIPQGSADKDGPTSVTVPPTTTQRPVTTQQPPMELGHGQAVTVEDKSSKHKGMVIAHADD